MVQKRPRPIGFHSASSARRSAKDLAPGLANSPGLQRRRVKEETEALDRPSRPAEAARPRGQLGGCRVTRGSAPGEEKARRGLGWFTQTQTLQGPRCGQGGQEPEVCWVPEGRQRGIWGWWWMRPLASAADRPEFKLRFATSDTAQWPLFPHLSNGSVLLPSHTL